MHIFIMIIYYGLNVQKNRIPYNFPSIEILNKYDNIEDYKLDDFLIKDYNYHEQIKLMSE